MALCCCLKSLPGTAGTTDDPAAASLRIIMQRQFDSMGTGLNSVMGRLRAEGTAHVRNGARCGMVDRSARSFATLLHCAGINPRRYISFFGLRSWTELKELCTTVLYVHSKMMIVDDRVVIMGSGTLESCRADWCRCGSPLAMPTFGVHRP